MTAKWMISRRLSKDGAVSKLSMFSLRVSIPGRVRHGSNRGYDFENYTCTRRTHTRKTAGFHVRISVN